jgi:hypothetical protein
MPFGIVDAGVTVVVQSRHYVRRDAIAILFAPAVGGRARTEADHRRWRGSRKHAERRSSCGR